MRHRASTHHLTRPCLPRSGLQNTTASINAILVQASVVIVPLLEAAPANMGSRAAAMVAKLLPSALALGGVVMLTVAPSEGQKQDDPTMGILMSLCSAACYALHTIRLSEYGDVDATVQAAGQVLVNTGLDVLAMPLSPASAQWVLLGGRIALRRLAIAATWNGIMVVGLTTWAMSYAQQAFAASTAALAYAMEPVFAAMMAAIGLNEILTSPQMFGGALVVGANIVAACGGGVWLAHLCFARPQKIVPGRLSTSDED